MDQVMASLGGKTTQVGAGTSLLGWLTSSEFGVVAGIVIGVVGLSMQWWYSRKRDRREQAEHEARMRGMG